jgi:membrane protease subunit HflK
MDFRTPEELLGLRKKFPMKPGLISLLVIIFLVIITVATMFYSIGPDERGVVLFLGKHTRTTNPGLHMKLPLGIETVTPVKVERIFKEEFGFRTAQAGIRSQYSAKGYLEESLMLTGDLNALEVTWIVQFRVKDPAALLYNLRNPVGTIRDISEAVMRRLVGDYSVDEVLTTKRVEINTLAEEELQRILDSYDSGIHIVTVKLQDVTPPKKVQPAFNEVNEAKQEKEQMVNQALQRYNKIIPAAKGGAEKILFEAEAYSIERTNRAKGDAKRFEQLLAEYKSAPEITRTRLYLESMEKILVQPKEKFIMDSDQDRLLPLLDFRSGAKHE